MKTLFAFAALAALMGGPVFADCSYPTPPDKLPDGNTATLDEMVAAQKQVKEYDKAINAYVECLKLEQQAAEAKVGDKDKMTPEQKADIERLQRLQIQKHNAAIDQLQSVADRFNEQVRVFKSKNDKKS
jgi:hypothetical protein